MMEGAKHNLPDADAQRAAESIRQLASTLTDSDLLLVLISGMPHMQGCAIYRIYQDYNYCSQQF